MNLEIAQFKIVIVENLAWQQGMSTSVKLGLETLLSINENSQGALFLLIDQPLLTTEHLLKIIKQMPDARCQMPETSIVASFYNDRPSVPALFDKKWFPALMQLQGDQGARKLLELHQSEVSTIPFPEGAFDLDTPADYEFLIRRFG